MKESENSVKYPGIGFLTANKEWLNIEETCIFLDISVTTLRSYVKKYQNFPQRKEVSPRKIYYSAALLKEWYASVGAKNDG